MNRLSGLLIILQFYSSLALANGDDSIAYIEQLLSEGKKVAILVIDMQPKYDRVFMVSEKQRVIKEQIKLINHFADNESVHFIDVRWRGGGETLPDLLFEMMKSKQYQIFLKSTKGAFDQRVQLQDPDSAQGVIQGELAPALLKEKVTDVVPIGCFDAQCVLETAKGASRDFQVTADRDLNIMFENEAEDWPERTLKMYKNAFDYQWQKAMKECPDLQLVPKSDKAKEKCE
ncbi:isochorismatase family protein [Endozoicomonas arenosclerae]|uniref:isochorismatase family protein n=1 Tax=Endozoicomonas arenosclerae TaxID=1633495 RepID=UPI0007863407|nr:isochorismatase family protein [Endozoicomonas arenosclerae]